MVLACDFCVIVGLTGRRFEQRGIGLFGRPHVSILLVKSRYLQHIFTTISLSSKTSTLEPYGIRSRHGYTPILIILPSMYSSSDGRYVSRCLATVVTQSIYSIVVSVNWDFNAAGTLARYRGKLTILLVLLLLVRTNLRTFPQPTLVRKFCR